MSSKETLHEHVAEEAIQITSLYDTLVKYAMEHKADDPIAIPKELMRRTLDMLVKISVTDSMILTAFCMNDDGSFNEELFKQKHADAMLKLGAKAPVLMHLN